MPASLDAAVIIEQLKEKAAKVLSAALGTTPLQAFDITSLGNFPYVWQDPQNVTKFNALTYQWISQSLKAGTTPYQVDGPFTNRYIDAISKVVWSLSKAEQAQLNKAANAATQQAAALQNAWLAAFRTLPSPGTGNPIDDIVGVILTWTTAKTLPTLTDIQNAVNFSDVLNNIPPAGQAVMPVFVTWLNQIGSQISLQNNVSSNNAYLARARRGVQTPSAANGGLALNDGSIQPAYQVANQVADIENALSTGSPITMEMAVTRSTSSTFRVSVEGSAGIDIPILDFLTIGVSGNANYFSSDVATTDNETTVKMSFPGVNLVNFGPTPFQMTGASSSWYWIDPIREAIKNGTNDVSGFKFSPVPDIDFAANGDFGFMTGVAISGYPTITIVITSSDYSKIEKTFQQSVSTSVSFLGIKLASASESTYSNNVKVDSANSTVTITLSPPQELVAGTVAASQGWILGVQPNFPAA